MAARTASQWAYIFLCWGLLPHTTLGSQSGWACFVTVVRVCEPNMGARSPTGEAPRGPAFAGIVRTLVGLGESRGSNTI